MGIKKPQLVKVEAFNIFYIGGFATPSTPNSLILRSLHLATHYKTEYFADRDPCEMSNLPESQIFKARFQ